MSALAALILARPRQREPIVTGLKPGERARRVVVRAGVPAERARVVRGPEELEAAARELQGARLVFVRATAHVVGLPLVEPLQIGASGTRVAVDAAGAYAGAIVAEPERAGELLAALREDFEGGDERVAARWDANAAAERVPVGPRARHPATTREEVRAADAWQWEGIRKPLDDWLTNHVYRPLARPFTRMFLRSPLSPNAITIISSLLSLVGCGIAAFPSYEAHAIGLGLLVFGGIIDCCDGEVARLRLEYSKLGGWLDAIGDDLARVALLVALGAHVAPRHPDLPIAWITAGALALTLFALGLIYWYCIFVIHSSNNQDYTQALGVGPGIGDPTRRTLVERIGDLAAVAARRDFMDLSAFGLALVALPEISLAGLTVGAVVGIAVVLPTHMRIVRSLRAARSE